MLGERARRQRKPTDHPSGPLQRRQQAGVLERAGGHDRRNPPAVGHAGQGRQQVRAQAREGRVHDHGVEAARLRQEIAQMSGIETRPRRGREQAVQQACAPVAEFVQGQGGAAGLGDGGDHPDAGRGLEH